MVDLIEDDISFRENDDMLLAKLVKIIIIECCIISIAIEFLDKMEVIKKMVISLKKE